MSSTAVAAFSLKNFNNNGIPSTSDVGIAASLRKKVDDTTFTFSFTDSSLKEPKLGKGVVLAVEKPLADGLKASLAHDFGASNSVASLTLNRLVNGSDVQVKAIYKRAGDVFIMEEQWKVDKNTRINGSYNFASEEAAASVTHTNGPWTASAAYNFARAAPLLSISRKAGADTVGATYAVNEDVGTVHWSRKPVRATLRAANVTGKPAWSSLSASIVATHEFDL
ncbi:hypothetical protein ACKKBF_B21340 [Auxenochlorella protothecoides x Auxenochlorella symbiontica]